MRAHAALALLASGCSFHVDGLKLAFDGGGDLAVGDLAVVNPLDGSAADGAFDGPAIDQGDFGNDLAPPPDLMPPLLLSHVPQHHLTDGTCDLTIASAIDTTLLRVDGAAPPAGCSFTVEMEGGALAVAVLSVRSLTVNGTVSVSGSRPLVVVAGGTITIAGTLDGSARQTLAGPGGGGGNAGAGAGGNGSHAAQYADSGGGGGGFAVPGGSGGNGNFGGIATGGTLGQSYGTSDLATAVPGGSGGGKISSEACTVTDGGGGGGGGSIQLSAGITLTVSGAINVGGGGGTGGCMNGTFDEGSGGGGGSGGAIFLESPQVSVPGGLWANGGGGGGGSSGPMAVGGNGGDALSSTTAASAGASGGMYGGLGGTGGTDSAPTPGAEQANGGGGGGSAGRIVVRSHGTIPVGAASPTPHFDPTL